MSKIIFFVHLYQTSCDPCFCSCSISGCLHKTSALIHDYGIHGAGIFVLFDPHEWSKEET